MNTSSVSVSAVFKEFYAGLELDVKAGLEVTSPADGAVIARLETDDKTRLEDKIARSCFSQKVWERQLRATRAELLERLSAAIKAQRESLANLITLEAGKTQKEALGEVDSCADVLLKTIKDAALPDFNGMRRCKERPPVGVVGLITSFNFPLVVAAWTIAPALLAGNSVLWKPSEKTPLTALAMKGIFDGMAVEHADLLHVLIGGRDIGTALVAHEQVDMISATGSVMMGKGIKATLAKKTNNSVKPILELGGNNGVIISDRISPEHLKFAVQSVISSFLGTSGQRCTNTRRIIVHASFYDKTVELFQAGLQAFLDATPIENPTTGISNDYGYGPLIDGDAYARFTKAQQQVQSEGGKILLGKRLHAEEWPAAFYTQPALAILPTQTGIMHEETFAPILFITQYDGGIEQALALLNAPENAGLVGGIYTQSQREADYFARHNGAGHCLINSPKGTGTPAFGMGFGGNKESGEGEILNGADPLRAFTRDTVYTRIAQNAEIIMDKD